jgi:16S rRNA C967 or C1407 C5-methylase (RsmB/RsmF family)/NOL1/NOP2/fmu family ribosome biogenesis protein
LELPKKFVNSLSVVPGLDDPAALISALTATIPVSIRLNASKIDVDRAKLLAKVPWNDAGRYLEKRPFFTSDPLLHAGAYYVQEASSMVIGTLVSKLIQQFFADEGIRVLDLCAAPGGKSTDIVSQLRPEDLLLSNEVVKSRAGVLKENVIKWGFPNHLVSQNDPRDFAQLSGYFDMIVVDAPCSGEGMFRKDAGAIEEWSVEHVELCSARQQRIVDDIWPSLTTGGVMIYATCTFNPKENEEVLNKLCASHTVQVLDHSDSGLAIGNYHEGVTRFFPHEQQGEGFSYFIVRKLGDAPEASLKKSRSKKIKFDEISFKTEGNFFLHNEQAIFQTHPISTELLQKSLRIIKSGVAVGTRKHTKWIPSHELALSNAAERHFPLLSLNLEQAQKYLRAETFEISSSNRGFNLVTFEGVPLGFINHLGNRFNNSYPTNWRIRTNRQLEYTALLD